MIKKLYRDVDDILHDLLDDTMKNSELSLMEFPPIKGTGYGSLKQNFCCTYSMPPTN